MQCEFSSHARTCGLNNIEFYTLVHAFHSTTLHHFPSSIHSNLHLVYTPFHNILTRHPHASLMQQHDSKRTPSALRFRQPGNWSSAGRLATSLARR
jgi:hypothetical protein